MASIKDEANAYKPKTTKNISDLDVVSTDLEIHTKESQRQDGEKFTYKYVEKDGVEYRVPMSVIADLQAILKKNPNVQKFQVAKSGTGQNTKYTVMPIM